MGLSSGFTLLKEIFMADNAKQTFFNLFEYTMALIEIIGKIHF